MYEVRRATILSEIDQEIEKLKTARALLTDDTTSMRKHGKPVKAETKPVKKARHLTPEGRARIVEAVRKRWAAAKKKA